MTTTADARVPTLVRVCFWACLVACGAMLVGAVVSRFSVYYAWDDAYMFVRYADNILATGVPAWNAGGGPTYGLTSPLYLAIVLPLRVALPESPALVIILASLVCGVAFVAIVLASAARAARRAGGLPAPWMVLFVVFALALSNVPLSAHVVSGMDTTFALAWAAAYIVIARRADRTRTAASAVVMGLWGGLCFFARPELLLYAFAIPSAMLLWPGSAGTRRHAAIALAVTTAALAAEIGLAALVLGSPLPLPFFAKSLKIYGESMYASYRLVPGRQLLAFLRSHWPLLVAIAAGALVGFRALFGRERAVNRGLLIGTGLLLAYEALFVLQIMHYHQRFYYPTLPALIFLAVDGLGAIAGRRRRLEQRTLVALVALGTVAVAVLLTPFARELWAHWRGGLPSRCVGRFDLRWGYRARWQHLWYRLDRVADLPDDLAIATTEVGLPAALSPRREIVDLSGLNTPTIARHGFSADTLFDTHQPDLFYMPHADNQRMDEQIRGHPYFQQHYDYFPAKQLGTLLGVAIHRGSRHHAALRAIAEGPP